MEKKKVEQIKAGQTLEEKEGSAVLNKVFWVGRHH